jgi:hypothetical protein
MSSQFPQLLGGLRLLKSAMGRLWLTQIADCFVCGPASKPKPPRPSGSCRQGCGPEDFINNALAGPHPSSGPKIREYGR